ncbi:hypothetical protein OKA04_23125 [Luteolibacter flavescens]|uniref:Uncharacterized protein n=1 Tax=Luteolibacter flavescens TaxID=1859460 RepID=A0ABT3FVP1_9BACT|nr:hypothetical protein [Luteolibacter flavescens]MCW1887649.1 hypothetical protein [Luteolibacter flavescens]
MLPRLISALVISTQLARAELPDAAPLIEEMSAAHAKLTGYAATWTSQGEGKSLDLTIAKDHRTGRFLMHIKAQGPNGNIESRQWSPDGKEVYVDNDGTRMKLDAVTAETNFYRSFREVFLEKETFDTFVISGTPGMLLGRESIQAMLRIDRNATPGWMNFKADFKTAAASEKEVTLASGEFGKLTIDRATGVLLRQEIDGVGDEKRVLERTGYLTEGVAEEMTAITSGWSTLGAVAGGLDPWSLKSRPTFLQFVIDGIESGTGSLEKLEEKLARKEELLSYGRNALAKSKEPVGGTLPWDKVMEATRTEARNRWKATLPEGSPEDEEAFAKYLANPANQASLRDMIADEMTALEGMIPGVVNALYGPGSEDGLIAKTATGRVAKASIEAALCRAYLAAKLEEKMAAAWGERENLD